jgi:cytoskeletal protein CcmA (bactofilin family)
MEEAPFTVGPTVRIWGTIDTKQNIEVYGFVDGSINGAAVYISAQAMVTGDVVASYVVVEGQVLGNIFADHLVLEESSSVEGEIYHTELDLKVGANFEGCSRRHDKPKTLAATMSYYESVAEVDRSTTQ